LLELSRQRLNPSLTEAQFEKCPHCAGSGVVKTLDYAAISAMRSLEEEGIKGTVAELSLNVPNEVAVYILNNKRDLLADIEKRYDFRVHIRVDEELKASEFRIDPIKQRKAPKKSSNQNHKEEETDVVSDDEDDKPKKNRRRGRRGGRRRNAQDADSQDGDESNAEAKGKESPADKPQKAEKKPVKKAAKKAPPKKADDSVEKASEDKADKKPAKKKPAAKKSAKSTKTQKPSNDSAEPEDNHAKEYEVVNEAPKKKKKGWWNRLVD